MPQKYVQKIYNMTEKQIYN